MEKKTKCQMNNGDYSESNIDSLSLCVYVYLLSAHSLTFIYTLFC